MVPLGSYREPPRLPSSALHFNAENPLPTLLSSSVHLCSLCHQKGLLNPVLSFLSPVL